MPRVTWVIWLVLLAGIVSGSSIAGNAGGFLETARAPRVIAWYPPWSELARSSLRDHASQLSTISPVWYQLGAEGRVLARQGARDVLLVHEAHEAGIRVIPSITNSFNSTRVSVLLGDDEARNNHINTLVREAVVYGYDGIDIDYEDIAFEDKDPFSQFITDLAAVMHRHGKTLSVSVQAKTYPANGLDGPGALDYGRLGLAADELRLMTYGWCWAEGCVGSPPPGPIAPVHWMERVIEFATQRVPPEKLILGIHLYGYDWQITEAGTTHDGIRDPSDNPFSRSPQAVQGRAVIWQDVKALIDEHQPQIMWWDQDGRGPVREHWFRYGTDHTVVYADRDSVAARVQLAGDHGLGGVVFWYLGAEDPDMWQVLPSRSAPVIPPSSTPVGASGRSGTGSDQYFPLIFRVQ